MKKRVFLSFFIAALIAIAAWSYYSYITNGIVYYLVSNDIDSIVKEIQSFGPLAAVILFFLVVIEVVAAPIPPLILYVVAGIIFGGFLGGIIILAANIVGAVIAFVFARTVGREYIKKKIGKENSRKFGRITEKYGPFGIFILRINPLTSTDLVSYLAGLSKIRLSHFIISTLLGLAPLIFSQTYLGSDIIRENSFLLTLVIWISILYFVFIIYLLFRLARKNKPRKNLKSV